MAEMAGDKNPSGKPDAMKPDPRRWYADFRALCREHVPAAVECLVEGMRQGDRQAAELLLAHAWGKPAQARGEEGENTQVTEVVYRWADPAEAPTPGGDDA
jgi:hypothetical protein